MKIILFGASGMVGSSVLRELLKDPEVESVLCIGRNPLQSKDAKLTEIIVKDLFDVASLESQVAGFDACIWAIGSTSVGLSEKEYAHITEELTLKWAEMLLRVNPSMSFCYCSAGGAGGSSMWAKVRQRVENQLKTMPFTYSGVVRPGVIRPGKGIKSKTPGYQAGINIMKPLFPIYPMLMKLFPFLFTTSERLGLAMLRIVKGQSNHFILESRDINELGSTTD